MAGDDWSREEVEATVGDYFAMLHDELAGLAINKAEHNERLRQLLRNSSKGSVEFKHATSPASTSRRFSSRQCWSTSTSIATSSNR